MSAVTTRNDVSSLHAKRFEGIVRAYAKADVERLRGSFVVEHTIARLGAARLWELLHEDEPVRALGALTGNMAVQQVRAGLSAIYLSGWQVAADARARRSAGTWAARSSSPRASSFAHSSPRASPRTSPTCPRSSSRAREKDGYTATRHQREVGTGYFDQVAEVISGGKASTLALEDSTEAHQF